MINQCDLLNFDALWQKSSRSTGGSGACVEVARLDEIVGARDSKLGDESPILTFGKTEWAFFLGAIKAGKADLV